MEPKKIALLVGALVIAAVTAVMAKNMFSQNSAPAAAAAAIVAAPTGPQVLVATRTLPVGTILTAESFKYQPWPKELIENAYYLQEKTNIQSLQGTVVRTQISAGQPLTQGSLVSPGDRGFLAAALGPGMRAITIGVNWQVAGVSGFAFPGDRVDVMLSQTVSGDGPALKAVETIMRNVRVLANDSRAAPVKDEAGNTQVAGFSTVTLEVTPRMAEKIAVAQSLGSISLVLRSLADNTADLDRAIAMGEVNVPEGMDAKKDKVAIASIAARPTDTGGTFMTGGDVSRFQRRSIPLVDATALSKVVGGKNVAAMNAGNGKLVTSTANPVIRVTRGSNTTEVSVGGK
jgi:pilus assembly protein CpaB